MNGRNVTEYQCVKSELENLKNVKVVDAIARPKIQISLTFRKELKIVLNPKERRNLVLSFKNT